MMKEIDFSALAESIIEIGKKLSSDPGEILPRRDKRLTSFNIHICYDGSELPKIEIVSRYKGKGHFEVSRKVIAMTGTPKIENANVGDNVTVTYSDSDGTKTSFGTYLGTVTSTDKAMSIGMLLRVDGRIEDPITIPTSLISSVKVEEAKPDEL